MKRRLFPALILLPLLQLPGLSQSASSRSTIEEIVRRSEDIVRGETSTGTFRMTVTTPDFERSMEMKSWWKGTEKALIVITDPRREAGNKTLKVDKELWMYLRNTETTIKIPPSMMLQSWNGSDFTNDDLVRESSMIDDYTISLLGEEPVSGTTNWKVELIPRPESAVVWARIIHWIRKTDYIPSKTEYYDERGNLVRTMVYSDIRKMGGRTIPAKWVMVNNAKPGNTTAFEYVDVQFDVPISDRVFSLRELERGTVR